MVMYNRLARSVVYCNIVARRSCVYSLNSSSSRNLLRFRQISQLVEHDGQSVTSALVRGLEGQGLPSNQAEALVRGLESQGLPSKQAEAVTAAITEVLNGRLQNIARSILVSKKEVEESEILHESNLSKFKSDLQTSREHHVTVLKTETEKLHGKVDKMRSDLRYALDKFTAGQRLDLNLEKGRIDDHLAKQDAENTTISKKVDEKVGELRAKLRRVKYDMIKYCVGALIVIPLVGVAVVHSSR